MIRYILLTILAAVTFLPAYAEEREAKFPFIRVSPRNPRYLETTDGKPFIPIGLNLIAPPRFGPNVPQDESLRHYEAWLAKLAANRGNYIRIWLSNGFWEIEHEAAGAYDDAKARRIDRVLELCRKYNLRAKFTIEHFREIDPNDVRQKWASKPLHHTSQGGTAHTMPEWLASEASRAQFKRKLDFYAGRYANEPAIVAWELWNEVNAVRGGDYMAWTEAMLPELQQRFPRTLCLQSLGSFDADRVSDVYRRHSLLPANDVAQVHRYLDLGANLEVCHGPVDLLAADAVRTLVAWQPGKPVLLAESGAVEPRHTGPFLLYARDKEGIILHDVLFAPFFAGAAGPGQIWHWDSYVDRNNLWHHFARFAEAIKDINPIEENFSPEMVPHPRLRIYALVGKNTLLLWLRDTQNTWQSELAAERTPLAREDVIDLFPWANLYSKPRLPRVRIYDPWKDAWAAGSLDAGTVSLPSFSRSLVVRIERAP